MKLPRFPGFLPVGKRVVGEVSAKSRSIVRRLRARSPRRLHGFHEGLRMQSASIDVFRDGKYEPEICRLLVYLVQAGWLVADVGAHEGFMTILMANLVGSGGRVVAFEAFPENAQRIRRNVVINGYQHTVVVENAAVTDGPRQAVALFPGRHRVSFEWNIVGHDLAGTDHPAELKVMGTSLDEYFSGDSPLHFVKIDIEGAEASAIRGMSALLNQSRPLVLVEFHDNVGWTGATMLWDANYELYDIASGIWLQRSPEIERVYQCLAVPIERVTEVDSRIASS
jgi:FkbM family methyltransferase